VPSAWFFGYSMPQNDIDAEKLFSRAIAENENLGVVEVIDPSPASAARFAGIVRRRPVVWYPDVWSFLESEPFATDAGAELFSPRV
jgi:hypothetical protein